MLQSADSEKVLVVEYGGGVNNLFKKFFEDTMGFYVSAKSLS